jgi:NAD(P)-dependent dehydrogenase (short-subunit alcohol dehydrogenase family)
MNQFSDTCLTGRTYLVTGASSGLGQATATLIAACGGKVLLGGRDLERLEQTRAKLDCRSLHVLAPFALKDADSTAHWVKGLATEHGLLNGVFHSAGTELIRPVRLTKQEHLDETFQSSVFAAFGIARAVGQKNVVQDGASVVLMSSVAGSTGQSGMTAYSAAKASIEGLVRALAVELAPRRIRVNAIAAGAIKTAMHERLTRNSGEAATLDYEKAHLLGFGEADDVANAAVFLLSDAAKWVTGTTLFVDGGYVVR